MGYTLTGYTSKDLPPPSGPYSQAVSAGDFVFVSGTIGFDPKTMELVPGGIKEQTRQTIDNIETILKKAGARLRHVVSARVYLADLKD